MSAREVGFQDSRLKPLAGRLPPGSGGRHRAAGNGYGNHLSFEHADRGHERGHFWMFSVEEIGDMKGDILFGTADGNQHA